MSTMNISLPDEMRTFVEEEVAKGGFSTASEYFRALVRDAQRRAAQEKLEAMLLEGLDSGPSTPMTRKDWDDIRRKGLKRAAELRKSR